MEPGGCVLIVDDEESIRAGVSRVLDRAGYRCKTGADGQEALLALADRPYDLVLLDIKMPGMSGIEVLERIVAEYPDISVVMATAMADTRTAIEAMRTGAYDYIIKPFQSDDLVMTVERALERRRLLLENKAYQVRLEQMVEQQVGEIRQYYQEAIQALAREQVALQRLEEKSGSDRGSESHDAPAGNGPAMLEEFADRLCEFLHS